VLCVAVVTLLLVRPLVGVLVVHGDAVRVLAAGLALELVAQRHHVVAALRRRRRDLVQQMLLLQRLPKLKLLVIQQVWLQLYEGKKN
jgi:hypothetical protein